MTRLVLRDAALADGRSASLRTGVSLAVADGRVERIAPNDEVDTAGAEVVDAGGATIVPGLVDAHSHLTMQGGSHWIERGGDAPDVLRQVARDNARRLVHAGVLSVLDVGAPMHDGRPLSLAVREELSGKRGQPRILAAGTWIGAKGFPGLWITTDGAGLRDAALAQLALGTDFVKIYMDPPAPFRDAPFTASELRATVEAVHAKGGKVTAHATWLDCVRACAEAGIDSVQHGFEMDDGIAATMRKNDVMLVSTLSVFPSWETFGRTTTLERFTSEEGRARVAKRKEGAYAAIAAAKRAGVRIATGTDFGGGSVRAGHLAWEVELLVDAGLEPYEALAAATWRGGEALGEPGVGRLEPGADADLVLVHGDPLSDPRALWRVWAVYQRGERVA
ncbi:MAG TPA: amidohydrolase family protein [Candidatus Limnocylindria bacterium]|nr:amidohydrolase family protein [Candidatus Limnocylindria bacterium]